MGRKPAPGGIKIRCTLCKKRLPANRAQMTSRGALCDPCRRAVTDAAR